jgi:hypothetical protein
MYTHLYRLHISLICDVTLVYFPFKIKIKSQARKGLDKIKGWSIKKIIDTTP